MIKVNVNVAKSISHDKRRSARAEEFKPLDVQATIPMFAGAAEAERQTIREKYDAIQVALDSAATVEELKEILETSGLLK